MRLASLLLLLCGVLWAADLGAEDLTPAQQYFQQGRAYHTGTDGRQRDLEKALRAYLQALRLDPQFYEVHVNAGKIYFERHDYRRAKAHFSEAIRLARARDDVSAAEEARISSDLGSCYYKEGNLVEAEKWYRGAIALDAGLVEAHYNLINLLLAADRQQEARAHLAVARQQAPSGRYGIFEGRLKTSETYADWLGATWLKQWLPVAFLGIVLGVVLQLLLRRGRKRKRRHQGHP